MGGNLKIIKGEFIRSESKFRNWVTKDGTAGPGGDSGFTAEPDRYHLYVSYACPWAHRILIFRALKGLQDVISVSVVHPLMPAKSWVFDDYPDATPDHVNNANYLRYLEFARGEYLLQKGLSLTDFKKWDGKIDTISDISIAADPAFAKDLDRHNRAIKSNPCSAESIVRTLS